MLLPAFDDPLEDPVYKVPPIGPHFSPDDLILSPRATRGVKAIGASHSGKRILVSHASQPHCAVFLPVTCTLLALSQCCCLIQENMVQAPSLLGANTHPGTQAPEDTDTVGGSRLDMTIFSRQSLRFYAVYWTAVVLSPVDHCSIPA